MTSERPGDKPKSGKAGRSELKRAVSSSRHSRKKPMNPFSVDLKGALEAPVHNWHIEAIEHQLMMMMQGGANRRLLVTQPPRSLKSICVSVAYVSGT